MSDQDPGRSADAERFVETLAASLGLRVVHLGRDLRRSASVITPAPGRLLTATEGSVMGAIFRHQPVTVSELARTERLSPPMISRVVAALVKLGLVETSTGDADRRMRYARLTKTGGDWIDRTIDQRDHLLAETIRQLSERELAALAIASPILEKIDALILERTKLKGFLDWTTSKVSDSPGRASAPSPGRATPAETSPRLS